MTATPVSAEDRMAALSASLEAMRPGNRYTDGPLVSMVVPTLDGAHHLRRLFRSLRDNTDYRSFELILVDNGSTDETADLALEDWGFPITHIANRANQTFSAACNQGIASSRGEYVLLLNNDIESVNPSWLGNMVAALREDAGSAAAGAMLVYPSRARGLHDPPPPHPDLTVQHNGIAFEWRAGQARGRNLDVGADPLRLDFARTHPVPGVTAACLLVERALINRIGGVPGGYIYGTEDWELCLRLRETGHIVLVGGSALFHYESASINAEREQQTRMNRTSNRQEWAERWGPRMSRTLRLDALQHRGQWGVRSRPAIGITVPADDPDFAASDQRLAVAMARSFDAAGWITHLVPADGEEPIAADLDAMLITVPGFRFGRLAPHVITVAWVLHTVASWERGPLLASSDLVLAGSGLIAARIAVTAQVDAPVCLPAISDAAAPGNSTIPAFETDYAFVGDGIRFSDKLKTLLEPLRGERFLIFGPNWWDETWAARYQRGELDREQHLQLYANASCTVHLRDGNRGSVDPAIMEAAMAGALPMSNDIDTAAEAFGDLLPTFSDRGTLRSLLDLFVADDDARNELLERLRTHIRSHHTTDTRAREIAEAIEAEAMRPKIAIKISPPDSAVAPFWGDTHFANHFARALRRLGYATSVHIYPEWNLPQKQDADIVVHLRGLHTYVPKAGSLNILWIVSHPDEVTDEECERYDLVLTASAEHAEELSQRLSVPVHTMLQAADPDVFYYSPSEPELHTDLLFVGNARWPVRQVPRWLMELEAPLTIYGANWVGFPEERLVRANHFPNQQLRRLYVSADILVNDHWPDMRERGFVANRLFDALAAGAFIISDHLDAIDEIFDGAVPTFSSKLELAETLERYQNDPVERTRSAVAGMRIVREHHTFDNRARQLNALIEKFDPALLLVSPTD